MVKNSVWRSRRFSSRSKSMSNKSLLLSFGLLLILGFAASGCKSSKTAEQGDRDWQPNTPSGLPEVNVKSADFAPIKEAATKLFAGRGYSAGPSNHMYLMTFDRVQNDKKRYDALRVWMRATEMNNGEWNLKGKPMAVEDWQTDLEDSVFVPTGMSQIQDFLEQIKLMVELPQS